VLAGASIPVLRRIERAVLGRAARLYATSAASRASVACAAAVDEDEIGVLPIPVDTARFAPEADDAWLGRLSTPVIGFLGRADDPRKNVELLVRAFGRVRGELPQARLRLIGSGSANHRGPGIESTGFVDDVAPPLRECALLVSTSRQEGFGIAVAEALSCGVPVVATPSGGPEEMLERSGAGRVLRTWSEGELAAAIAELLGDEEKLREFRARGRTYVEREHAPARLRELLTAAFEELDG
jgi:phosphatidylinositol alpha-mannosyltransferase